MRPKLRFRSILGAMILHAHRRIAIAVCALGFAAACAPKSITPMPTKREADPATAMSGPQGPACRSNADCEKEQECFAPDFVPGPGTQPPPCPDNIQRPRCEACTATSCGAGEECDPHGECVARSCTRENELLACPHNFECTREGRCGRKSCKQDADCEGACALGFCYPRPGACEEKSYCCPP